MLTEYANATATHQAKTGTDARGQATHGPAHQIALVAGKTANATQTDKAGEESEANAYLTTAEVQPGDLIDGRRVTSVKPYTDIFTGALLYRKAVTE